MSDAELDEIVRKLLRKGTSENECVQAADAIAALRRERISKEPTDAMLKAAENCYWTDFRHRWLAAYVAAQIDNAAAPRSEDG